jgi:hypothetical protein
MSYRRLTHWDDGRMSQCLTEDLLTETMEEFHHVLQKTYALRRWKNVTMSYRRLTHWDDGRMSPCLTEDFLTGMMIECHHVLQKTVTGTMDAVRHCDIRPSSQ